MSVFPIDLGKIREKKYFLWADGHIQTGGRLKIASPSQQNFLTSTIILTVVFGGAG